MTSPTRSRGAFVAVLGDAMTTVDFQLAPTAHGYSSAMQVRLLGPIDAASSAGNRVRVSGSKLRGLIAILALEAGTTVSNQRLIDALWGDQLVKGQNALHALVSKLRGPEARVGQVG